MTRARWAPSTGGLVRSTGAQLRISVATLGGAACLAAIVLTAVPAHPQDTAPDQSLIHVQVGPEKDTAAAFVPPGETEAVSGAGARSWRPRAGHRRILRSSER